MQCSESSFLQMERNVPQYHACDDQSRATPTPTGSSRHRPRHEAHREGRQQIDQKVQFVSYAEFDEIFWLFDPRHSLLLRLFERHVKMNGGDRSKIVDCRDMFLKFERAPLSNIASLTQPEPERINEEFMANWARPASSRRIAVIGFTTEGLENRDGLSVFGASGSIVRSLQNKASQMAMLSRHGFDMPEYRGPIMPRELPRQTTRMLRRCDAVYVQPVYSSGGEYGSRLASTADAIDYLHRLEESHPGFDKNLLLTRFIDGAKSISAHGIISKRGAVHILAVVDLLQNRFKFDGFLFPSFSRHEILSKASDLAARIGSILFARGYWGWYSVDFIVSKDERILINEINTRFAGESAFIASMSMSNVFDVMLASEQCEIGPRLPIPENRIIVAKIRPNPKSKVRPPVKLSNPESFMKGKAHSFRESYIDEPIFSHDCHFVGLFGASVPLEFSKETCLQIYAEERTAADVDDEVVNP